MSLRSPVGRVIGLGSAREGSGHWVAQRISSIALAVLTLWFAYSLLRLGSLEYAAVLAWISEPFNAVLLAILGAAAVYHSHLGIQVVVEDYVSVKSAKIAAMLIVTFVHWLLAALAIFAVLRVALGSGA